MLNYHLSGSEILVEIQKKNTVTELVRKGDLKLKRKRKKKRLKTGQLLNAVECDFMLFFPQLLPLPCARFIKFAPPSNAICIAYTDHRLFTPPKEMLFCHVTYNYLYHVNKLRNDHNGDLFRVCIDLFVNWKCSLWICLLAIFTEVTHEEFLAK